MTTVGDRTFAETFESDSAIRETFGGLRAVSLEKRRAHAKWGADLDAIDASLCEDFLELALRVSESEVEKRFLVALVFVALADALPFRLDLQEPTEDLAKTISEQREWYRGFEKMEADFGGKSPPLSQALLEVLTANDTDRLAAGTYLHWRLYRNAVIAVPQAKVPRTDSSRAMRVDVALWDANSVAPAVICEIDGYEWHGAKEPFVADRQRDRTLSQSGFRVIRFAASEILANPIGCVHDLIRVLRSPRGADV